MKSISVYHRKIHLWFILSFLIFAMVGIFVMPSYQPVRFTGDEMYRVTLDGVEVGTVSSEEAAGRCLKAARRQVAGSSDDLTYMHAEMTLTGEQVLWGQVDPDSKVTEAMTAVLRENCLDSLVRCYTVKIGETQINLESGDDVETLLQDVLSQYDTEHQFIVSLVLDTSRQLGGLTTEIRTTREQENETIKNNRLPIAGINEELDDVLISAEPETTLSFDDYDLGLTSIAFGKRIEIAEAFLPQSEIMDLASAEVFVTQSNAEKQVYEVKAGDTLSQIAENYSLTVDDLLAMNPNYEDENAVIRIGDLITVTVPEAILSVDYTKEEYYEEDYNEDTVYVDNDNWYTTKTEVVQEAQTGHRRVIAEVSYEDETRLSSNILKQEVTIAAVPRIIERGTQAPPTYVWPVSGGYVSSGFGGRSAPKKGASTYHKGIDIACSTGTAVMASTGGTVSLAGWQSGYGYVVYIDHGNGVQTRYGHLSKILVSVGEHVSQGERIALSGNTGNSTGPHCHFEIRINGEAVNPLSYLN